jgi:plastocyanin
MRPRTSSLAMILAAGLLAASGCGDDSDDESAADSGGGGGGGSGYGAKDEGSDKSGSDAAGAHRLKLTADPGGAPKFDKTSLTTKPGKVTLVLRNPSQVPHAIEVEGKDIEKEGKTVEKGGVSKVTVDLPAGEYEFYCPVGNHKDAGMEGTLTVG